MSRIFSILTLSILLKCEIKFLRNIVPIRLSLSKINALIAKGESENLEFKRSTGQLSAAFETLCAFLNGNGGIVIIGVNDNGKIVGQEVADGTKQAIANEIAKIEPHPQIDITYVDIDKNKKIILLTVEKNQHIPYVYDGRAFSREQTVTKRMTQHRYEQLLVTRGQLNYSWEEAIADGYSLQDLDENEIYKTVANGIRENRLPASAQRENIPEILDRLGLTVGNNLKCAAIVLYAKPSSIKFVQCMIKMARFRGINKLGEFIDNQQISGNAFFLLSEADAFLRRHLPIASYFKEDQFKRIDKPALPVFAVREALINAFCHRDYADRESDISLAIFDDRLEIWNSGLLMKKLTVEDLKRTHRSILRNKLIANVFYVRGLIEKWGIGTNKIIDLCHENGIPEPIFEENFGGLSVTFKFKEPISSYKILKTPAINSLTDRQKNVLKILAQADEFSLRQIAEKLENPPALRTLGDDLAYLKQKKLVGVKGRAKAARWFILK